MNINVIEGICLFQQDCYYKPCRVVPCLYQHSSGIITGSSHNMSSTVMDGSSSQNFPPHIRKFVKVTWNSKSLKYQAFYHSTFPKQIEISRSEALTQDIVRLLNQPKFLGPGQDQMFSSISPCSLIIEEETKPLREAESKFLLILNQR